MLTFVGDATHDDTIQSFSASHHDNPVHLSSSDPFHVGAHQADHGTHLISGQPYSPALAHLSATGQTPGSCSIRPKLSPTQTSDAQARPVVTYQRKRDTERTPLKRKDTNKDFQLSSSPPSADDRHLSDEHKLPNNPSSEPEIIEIIGSDRIRGDPGSSSSRGRLLPEIVLSSKKRSITRQESPDPLDSFAGIDRHQADDRSVPQIVSSSISSSAGPSNSPLIEQEDNGRRSGRVKAATEKKEAEKEERRRLRRERKAREEEEKRRGEARGRVSDQVSSSRRATPRKRQETVEDDVRSGDTPHSTNSIIATPATANKKTPVPKRMKPSAKKRSQKSTNDDQNLGVVTTSNPPRTNVDENTTTITMSEVQNDGALDHESDEIIISDAPLAKELSATTSGVVVETAPVVSPVEESIKALSHEAPTAPVSNAIEGSSNSHSEASSVRARTPLSPPARHSPGPQGPSGSSSRPGGIKWQTCELPLLFLTACLKIMLMFSSTDRSQFGLVQVSRVQDGRHVETSSYSTSSRQDWPSRQSAATGTSQTSQEEKGR